MPVIRSWARTDVGKKRPHNEDAYLVDEALGLYAVADGMGGHAAGEVASAAAVKSLRDALAGEKAALDAFTRTPSLEARESAAQAMERAVQRACADVYALSLGDPGKRGMGTTLVALLACGRNAVIAHVGDSRAYLFRNVITRAIGIQRSVAVDTLVTDLLPGDVYVLCTDGLHGYLGEDELPALLGQEKRRLVDLLVDLALQRGGKDNVTGIALAVEAGADEESADVEGRTEVLRRIPLFQHMTYKELLGILGIARGRQFQKGQTVIREGETGDELFVLFRGKVQVTKGEMAIASLKAGGHFGEMGLVDQAPRSATVTAVEETSAVAIDRDSLLRLMRRDSLLAVKLLWSFVQVLSERLRNTNEALTGLKSELDRARTAADSQEGGGGTPPPFGS